MNLIAMCDTILGILDTADAKQEQIKAEAAKKGITKNQLLASAIVGAVHEELNKVDGTCRA